MVADFFTVHDLRGAPTSDKALAVGLPLHRAGFGVGPAASDLSIVK
jgi:hypothetical protein